METPMRDSAHLHTTAGSNGNAIRDSMTLPSRQWCPAAVKEKWADFKTNALNQRDNSAFTQALVILVSNLISPETGVFRRLADVDGFFEPEYLYPDERMFLLQFVCQVARNQSVDSTNLTLHDIPRKVWRAFLSPVLSDARQITAFDCGATSASKIKPLLEQLGLFASFEEILAVQYRLWPVLASVSFVPFKAPLPISITEIEEVFDKAQHFSRMIGPVPIPKNVLIILAMSHFSGSRYLYLQEWSETVHAQQLSSAAMQQLWTAASPNHGLAILVFMLLRHYYVFGIGIVHGGTPQIPEDLSPQSSGLLTEAVFSYSRVFDVTDLLHELFPKFGYLMAQLSPGRQRLWEGYWETHLPNLMPRRRKELVHVPSKSVMESVLVWGKACVGHRRAGN